MQINREIQMHLDRKDPTPAVDAVQGETARSVTLALFDKGQPWTVPADASVLIRYRKEDLTGGVYDSLPDGTRAWNVRGNLVDIRIAPQALAVSGVTAMQAAIVAEGEELASFIFRVCVESDPSIGTLASDDYINIGQWLMPRIYQFVSEAEAAAATAVRATEEALRTAASISSRYDPQYAVCGVDPADGLTMENASAITSAYFPLLGKQLGVAFSPLVTVRLFYYDAQQAFLGADLTRTESFELDIPVGAAFARIEIRYAVGFAVDDPKKLSNYVTVYIPNTSAEDADRAQSAASQAFMSADRANTAATQALLSAQQALLSAQQADAAAQTALDVAKTGVKTVNGISPDKNGNVEVAGDGIPNYWESHLASKIAAVKALQEAGGKDCFSFVVIADPHYESNLGKCSPAIAKRIMDACGIKYCLCLGDMQTRHGAKHDESYIDNEWIGIEEMLSPIRDRLLATQGNHDGSYGWFDLNGDGLINDDANGDGVVDSYDKDVHNFTPQKLYARIFRKVSAMEGVHFSEDGTGYYVDDTGSKVRYIILNSHVNKYELNDDGLVKYNNMYNFRFGQAQYDMVIEALSTVPSDSWSVVVASHVPLDRTGEYIAWGGQEDENGAQTGSPADCVIMMRLLNAYQNKTAYTGIFTGTQGGSVGFENLIDTTSADWWADSRLDSSGTQSTGVGRNVTNYIPYTDGDMLKIKGAALYASDRFAVYGDDKAMIYLGAGSSLSTYITTDEDGVLYFDTSSLSQISPSAAGGAFIRLPVQLVDGTEPIITTGDLNTSTESFDAVSVSVDFAEAKGTLVSYHGGHVHEDITWDKDYAWNGAEHSDFPLIATRCDGAEENDAALKAERIAGTITEQSFDVFTVNKATGKIYATKIGAGADREIHC